jgi:hypothetical protein
MRPPAPNSRRRHLGNLLAAVLFAAGAVGILASPTLGVVRGKEMLGIPVQKVRERATFTVIESSEFIIPTVSKGRGIFWMSGMMIASIATMFSGVYVFSAVRRSTDHGYRSPN